MTMNALLILLLLAPTLLFSLFVLLLLRAVKKKRSEPVLPNLPQVPDPHWLLGNLITLQGRGDFRQGYHDVYVRHADPSGRTGFWFLAKPSVSILSGKDARAVLNASSYRTPVGIFRRHTNRFLGMRAIPYLMGREWRSYRSAVHRALNPAALQAAQPSIERVGRTLAQSLQGLASNATSGTIVREVLPLMKMATVDVFALTAFGIDLHCSRELHLSPVAEAFGFLTEEYSRRLRTPFDLTSHLYWIPTKPNRLHGKKRKFIRSFLDDIVSQRRKAIAMEGKIEGENNDLLTHLLKANSDQLKTPDSGAEGAVDEMSDETLTDTLMTLLFAGYDSTSVTLTYALYNIAKNPKWEERVVKEIESVAGSAQSNRIEPILEWERLVLIRAIILETLRLYPPAPMTTRDLEKPLELSDGFILTTDVQLVLPLWCIQRDERNFPRAEEFLPERWVRRTAKGDGWEERNSKDRQGEENECEVLPADRESFVAFAGGGRDCVGKKLAMREAVTLLFYMLRNLKFDLVDEDYEVTPLLASFIQKPKDGLPMIIRRR